VRFGIDVDGCIASFTDAFINAVNTLWPGRLPLSYEPTDWDWTNSGLTVAERNHVYAYIEKIPNFWMSLKPIMENVSAIALHRKRFPDDELYYVTARRDTAGMPTMHQTQEWLRMCGIYGLGTGVIVDYGGDKVPIFNALDCDLNVDDKLEAVIAHSRDTKWGVLLDRMWNRSNRPSSIIVVSNLSEFFALARGKNATV
jgi:uncharacterized HAD superfamily protein